MPTCPHSLTINQPRYNTRSRGTDQKDSARYCMQTASMPASRASRHSTTWTWPESVRAVVGGDSSNVEDPDQAAQRPRPVLDGSNVQYEDDDSRTDRSSTTREPQHRSSSEQANRMPQPKASVPMTEPSRAASVAISDLPHPPSVETAATREDKIRHPEGRRRRSRHTELKAEAERPSRRRGVNGRTHTSHSFRDRHGSGCEHRTGSPVHPSRHRRRRRRRHHEHLHSPHIEWWELAIAAALGLCFLVYRAIRNK